jgi:DNA-binding response OmpR family regulator
VLAVLLRHAGEEVGKERLLQAGWPNRIVHENSLAKAIGRLRQVLGEQGSLLETVYGHGYKLNVAPLLVPADGPAAAADVAAGGGEAPAGTSRARPWWIAAAAVVATAAIGATVAWQRPAELPEPSYRATAPITGDAPDAIGRLLWVDDNPQNNLHEKRFFEDHRIAVHNVTASADALRLLAMYDYAVVISDMGRGEDRLAGLRLAEEMRARGEATPLIIYTVRPDGADAQRAQRELVAQAGGQGVVVTPQEVRTRILELFGNPPPRASR